MSYSDDLDVDMFSLHTECKKQATTFMTYAEQYANSVRKKDKLKAQLELIEAELDAKIRSGPDAFGIAKITETVVSNTIIMQKEYKNALSLHDDAVEEMHILKGATKAFEHKKSALESLTKLHLQGYYADPKEQKIEEENKLEEHPRLKLRKRKLFKGE